MGKRRGEMEKEIKKHGGDGEKGGRSSEEEQRRKIMGEMERGGRVALIKTKN